MTTKTDAGFQSLTDNIGLFNPENKKLLIPEMNRAGAHLLAAVCRSYGIRAQVLETYKGMNLGQEYTSGKECYPCQVTLGDILYFIQQEKEKLGSDFDPENYVYFMPESDGPCRFGMYNKYQRIVLDRFPGLNKLKIGAITTRGGYSLAGMLEKERVRDFRKMMYLSLLVADILDRLLWRVRPYEKQPGSADRLMEQSLRKMEAAMESYAAAKNVEAIFRELDAIIGKGKELVAPTLPRKPRIGIVGEIYLRMHTHANQDLIRTLEKHGAEVVCASLVEWVNFVSYIEKRTAAARLRLNLKRKRLGRLQADLKQYIASGLELMYRQSRQKTLYRRAWTQLDLAEDIKISHLERILNEEDTFSFDIDTEASLSIAGIMEYAKAGYNGVVNVYPFTCMPGMTTAAIAKPLMARSAVPYLDAPYDASIQPAREAAIRTFMYQAQQHQRSNGRAPATAH
jgi:predicted nucleotide-binding protein (sugar kinase/HSP70/actin superfamily)